MSWCLVLSMLVFSNEVHAMASQTAIRQMMAKYDPILLYVSRLLQPDIARDAEALYAWCRRLDQLVDDAKEDSLTRRAKLEDWATRLDELWSGTPRDELDAELMMTLKRHPSLGLHPFEDMLQGMMGDAVESRRIRTSEELDTYAYQVGGTVGLMLLPILGVRQDEEVARAKQPAIALGKAIQLINILRDARPDSALGRIYLPQDEMSALNISDTDVLLAKCTPAYCSLVKRKAMQAEALLREAEEGSRCLPGAGPLLVVLVIELYRDYLLELDRRGYDNLNTNGDRVSISFGRKVMATFRAFRKLLRLPP